MYSPAESPFRTRAAPAKKRIWSAAGGTSSSRVSWTGLPVFSLSRATSSSALASIASAIWSRAGLRSDGVASRQTSNPLAAAWQAASMSAWPESGASANTWPVEGATSSMVRPSAASRRSPPTTLYSLRVLISGVSCWWLAAGERGRDVLGRVSPAPQHQRREAEDGQGDHQRDRRDGRDVALQAKAQGREDVD